MAVSIFILIAVAWLPFVSADNTPVAKKPALQEPEITQEERSHWAFQKPVRPALPAARNHAWLRTPVDAFILQRLEKAGIAPAPPADKPTLLRRVTFDLIGLPPTPLEVADFLKDSRPDAYERVVERLLASPHHGERWAQHWLDVVRYAESNGYEADGERPHAWHYRDYVIRAFNDDLPYDRFVSEQIAGDLLAKGNESRQAARLLIATGFHRCGPIHLVGGNSDPEINRQEVLTEMTGAIGSTFLGLTIGCARCHDHKFDPISQADYYRVQGFFADVQSHDYDIATAEEKARVEKEAEPLRKQIGELRKQVQTIDAPYRSRLAAQKIENLEPKYRDALSAPEGKRTAEQRKLVTDAQPLLKVTWDEVIAALRPEDRVRRAALREKIHDLEAHLPAPAAKAWSIHKDEKPSSTHVLIRGNPKRKGAEVHASFPRVLGSAEKPKPLDRVELARWLTDPRNPLTARVIVNRVWQHHFGRGLVASANDFGKRGERPTHPELLDWLACELTTKGWSLKDLHRMMVLSSTYRQQSVLDAEAPSRKLDPGNRLLSRMNRVRLEGESLRDNALAASGSLNRELYGQMVRVPLEPEVYDLIFTEDEPDGLWHVTPDKRLHDRRSIYLFAKRNVRLPLLEAFDRPDSLSSCPVRPVSTFAPQALILLNGPFLQEQSKKMACFVGAQAFSSKAQVETAYQLALCRLPGPGELRAGIEFLQAQAAFIRQESKVAPPQPGEDAQMAALADFCLALLNCNEFLYVN